MCIGRCLMFPLMPPTVGSLEACKRKHLQSGITLTEANIYHTYQTENFHNHDIS